MVPPAVCQLFIETPACLSELDVVAQSDPGEHSEHRRRAGGVDATGLEGSEPCEPPSPAIGAAVVPP